MTYPNVFRRYLGTLVDGAILASVIYAVLQVPAIVSNDKLATWLIAVVVLSYEPLLTSYFCTPGQALMRLRVRTVDGLKQISYGRALGRMIVKYLLGVVSFVTVPARKDRRAIHDLSLDTIVVEAHRDDL